MTRALERLRARPRHARLALLGAALLTVSAPLPRVPAAAPLGAVLGWRVAEMLDTREARRRGAEIERALPALLDRMLTCSLAGLSVGRSLAAAADGVDGPLGAELRATVAELDAGIPWEQAWEGLAARCDTPAVAEVAAALRRAARLGTPLVPALSALARDSRARARAAAESEARTAPLRMVFPVVLCFLPAFLVLTIAPIALTAVRSIGRA